VRGGWEVGPPWVPLPEVAGFQGVGQSAGLRVAVAVAAAAGLLWVLLGRSLLPRGLLLLLLSPGYVGQRQQARL